jgi:hypothetical protein
VGVGIFMVFRWRCGSVVCGPWHELQMVGELTLGVCGAELRQRVVEVVERMGYVVEVVADDT